MKFTKMQGCGNDYIYVNCFDETVPDPSAAAIRLSDRHFGIGGDGLVLICPSDAADFCMEMYNADGSRSEMCGNAIRCVGKYLYDNGMVPKTEMTIATASGVRHLQLFTRNGKVSSVTVDMGKAELNPPKIPVDLPGDKIICHPVTIGNNEYCITCVATGNPHCVVFVDNVDKLDLQQIGPQFENSPLFPERVNT